MYCQESRFVSLIRPLTKSQHLEAIPVWDQPESCSRTQRLRLSWRGLRVYVMRASDRPSCLPNCVTCTLIGSFQVRESAGEAIRILCGVLIHLCMNVTANTCVLTNRLDLSLAGFFIGGRVSLS